MVPLIPTFNIGALHTFPAPGGIAWAKLELNFFEVEEIRLKPDTLVVEFVRFVASRDGKEVAI